jgi:hypothetical protein
MRSGPTTEERSADAEEHRVDRSGRPIIVGPILPLLLLAAFALIGVRFGDALAGPRVSAFAKLFVSSVVKALPFLALGVVLSAVIVALAVESHADSAEFASSLPAESSPVWISLYENRGSSSSVIWVVPVSENRPNASNLLQAIDVLL